MLLVTSVLLTFSFLALKEKFLMWFGASQATFPYANTYVTIYTMGTVFALLSTGMNSFLIAQGFSGLGMVTVMLGAVFNIVLDPASSTCSLPRPPAHGLPFWRRLRWHPLLHPAHTSQSEHQPG